MGTDGLNVAELLNASSPSSMAAKISTDETGTDPYLETPFLISFIRTTAPPLTWGNTVWSWTLKTVLPLLTLPTQSCWFPFFCLALTHTLNVCVWFFFKTTQSGFPSWLGTVQASSQLHRPSTLVQLLLWFHVSRTRQKNLFCHVEGSR